ncbi:MAG: hypothetical protein V3R80_03515, partial [Candidatus Tectomicrobia bacterium]
MSSLKTEHEKTDRFERCKSTFVLVIIIGPSAGGREHQAARAASPVSGAKKAFGYDYPHCKKKDRAMAHVQFDKVVQDVKALSPAQQQDIDPFEYNKRQTRSVLNIGGKNVPVVMADFSLKK